MPTLTKTTYKCRRILLDVGFYTPLTSLPSALATISKTIIFIKKYPMKILFCEIAPKPSLVVYFGACYFLRPS